MPSHFLGKGSEERVTVLPWTRCLLFLSLLQHDDEVINESVVYSQPDIL